MRQLSRAIVILLVLASYISNSYAADRYWVHPTIYQNHFSTVGEFADWQLIEDDGTGGFAPSGSGTGLLTMDDAAGSFANRLFNINGGSPRFMPFDGVNGRVELLVKSITGGNQRIFLQAQEFDGSGTYLGQVDILPARSATGFFSVNFSSIVWDPSTLQVRFIVGGENFSGLQGTAEFAYFSYSNSANNWNNTANWSATSNGPAGASVPGPGDNAIFDGAGNNNASCLLDINASVNYLAVNSTYSGNIDLQNFQMTVGASGVNLAGGGITGQSQNLQVDGSVAISGGAFRNPSGNTFISGDVIITGGILNFDSGTVNFNGNVDQNFSSTVIVPVNNVIVNKASGAINFSSDILVADSLVLTQGILNMGSNSIHLGISGSNPGTLIPGAGMINGKFVRWLGPGSSGGLLFPMGNATTSAPLIVQVVSAPSSGGTITASYADAVPGFTAVSFPDNGSTITQLSTASWFLQTSGIGDGNYALSLTNDHLGAIPSITDVDLTLANGVVGTYQPATGSTSNPNFSRSALAASDLANTFFAGISSTPLPVEWLSFDVVSQNGIYSWIWTLSQEENVAWYAPQYSIDATHYITAGKITQTDPDHSYRFNTPLTQSGNIYFRVQEMDLDGKANYSIVKLLSSTALFSFYPNPARSQITLQWPYGDAKTIHTVITDEQGKLMIDRTDPYNFPLIISLAGLPAGSLFIRCNDNEKRRSDSRLFVKTPD